MKGKHIKDPQDTETKRSGGNGHPTESHEVPVHVKHAEGGAGPETEHKDKSFARAGEQIAPKKPKTDEEKIADLTNHLQRLAAEFDNFRKRAAKEAELIRANGNADLVTKILPVLDNMELANDSANSVMDVESLKTGFQMIHRQLWEILQRDGLEMVQAEIGQPMDINQHEVMWCEPDDNVPPQTVLAALQPGYKYKGVLIRPAKVKVSCKPSDDQSPEQKERNDV